MNSRPWIPSIGVLIVASLIASAALADGGRTPIFQPTVITAPGHYLVTRDFSGSGNVIWIQSPDVLLDLNGHMITAVSSGDRGVYVTPNSGSQGLVEIRNGKLRGGAACVAYAGNPGADKMNLRLDRLDMSTTGAQPVTINGAQLVEVTGCNVHDYPGTNAAILASSGDSNSFTGLFEGNTVRGVGAGAFQLHSMSGGAVRRNVISGFGTSQGAPGISLEGSAVLLGGIRIEGNVIRNGGGGTSGITAYAGMNRNAIVDNVIEGSYGDALMVASNGNRISGNVLGSIASNGTTLAGSDNTFERNIVESGSGNGVVVQGTNNLIDNNTIEGHLGYALAFFNSGNAYRGNMLRNNVTGTVFGSATDAGGNIP